MDAPDSAPNPAAPDYLKLTTTPAAPRDDENPPGITFTASGADPLPVSVEKVMQFDTCGAASCPDQPFAKCDYPPGHAAIHFYDAETGAVTDTVDHGDSLREVWWRNGEDSVTMSPGQDIPEPTPDVIDGLIAQIEAAGRA